MKLFVATHNMHKLDEISKILSGAELVADDPGAEETGDTFEENALIKARAAAALHPGEWVMADDSGLEVRALGGAPGVRSARYAGEPSSTPRNNAKLLAELSGVSDRRARFTCAIALIGPDGRERIAAGHCSGRIAAAPSGAQGFGYDPLFIPDGFGESFAVLGEETKNSISHRARALAGAKRILGLLSTSELAATIDHTILSPVNTLQQVVKVCEETLEYGFACAMIPPFRVKDAARRFAAAGVRIGTVIGFPLGQNAAGTVLAEARTALDDGARDLDFVLNRSLVKDVDPAPLARWFDTLAGFAGEIEGRDVTTKLIIEACDLDEGEKARAADAAARAGFDFVKTSTGFGRHGATVEDVEIIARTVGTRCGVKAAGGIRDRATALAMLRAGASRIGTSSGPAICGRT